MVRGMKKLGPWPRIEALHITNFRALREVHFRDLTPLTVLVGPNGSGKSTVLDALSFLSAAVQSGLRDTWNNWGRGREIRTRGQDGWICLALSYREDANTGPISYSIKIGEVDGSPEVIEEYLSMGAPGNANPDYLFHYKNGVDSVYIQDTRQRTQVNTNPRLRSADIIAVSSLGQLADNPRIAALREFITNWHVSEFSAVDARGFPNAGPREHLSRTGENLANVVQYLSQQHPDHLGYIFRMLVDQVPRLEKVLAEEMADGRLLLRFKDAPFNDPILARFASDGTLKLLAYLVLLHDPAPPPLIGIEEPENYLHPRLMHPLAEVFRNASGQSQLLVTSHSPYFLNGLHPDEVRVLYRDEHGHTQVKLVADIEGIREFVEHGGLLGDLWMEGHFNVGDPLSNSGMPRLAPKR